MNDRIASILSTATGKPASEWESVDGPDSGVGVDYWFVHPDGLQAYVNDDQGHLTIDVTSTDD